MKNTRELLEKALKIEYSDVIQLLKDNVDRLKNRYDTTLSGMYYHIIMDENGELKMTGLLSEGSQTIGCYRGEEMLLYRLKGSCELDYDELDQVVVNSIDNDIKEKLKNDIIVSYDIDKDEINDFIENNREIYIGTFIEKYRDEYDNIYNDYVYDLIYNYDIIDIADSVMQVQNLL